MRRHWTVLPGTNQPTDRLYCREPTWVRHTDRPPSRICSHTHQGGQGAASPLQPSPQAHASHVFAWMDVG